LGSILPTAVLVSSLPMLVELGSELRQP